MPVLTKRSVTVVALLALSFAGRARLDAQDGRVQGLVTDSAGRPLGSADVSISARRLLTRTDDQGRFSFGNLDPGEVEIGVRRLGFEPAKVFLMVTVVAIDSVTVKLVAQAYELEGVDVSAGAKRRREGIEDFYRRRVRGMGVYFTRADIISRNASRPSDMVRSTPGVQLVRTRSGQGIRFMTSQGQRRECIPVIWVDGQRANGLELDDIPIHDIEGIELYQGPSTTPMQFSQATSVATCGTIVVWSRPPGR
jgi:hypothetical protein